MPEAVIVSAVRSPIGRAVKGSLKDMPPDDLTVQMVTAVLEKTPGLDPRDIGDLILGWGSRPASRATISRGCSRSSPGWTPGCHGQQGG
jgi:acetyl-CoA C-acetyltransferase